MNEQEQVGKLSNDCAILYFAASVGNKLIAMSQDVSEEQREAYLKAIEVVMKEAKEQAE